MQPSPYTPGEIAPEVPGRDEQLADIDERLSYVADLGRFVGRIRVDTAPRGLGKTSMLAQVERMAKQRKIQTIWATGGDGPPVVAQIATQITGSSWSAETKRRLRRLAELTTVTVQLGVPGVAQVGATARTRGRRHEVPVGGEELATLIHETAASALREHRRGLVLLVDEIQAADGASLSALGHAWQHLQRRPPVPAAVFAAGLPDADRVIRKAVTFSERFAYRPLGLLSDAAARAALVRPALALGVTWDPPALERAVEAAQGFPFTVQLIGEGAWIAAGRPDPGGLITVAHVAAARRAIRSDLETLHRARWKDATAAERTFLAVMAALGETDIARADIARALGVATEHISEVRDRLINKGIIRPTGRGLLGFTIGGFAAYVRSQQPVPDAGGRE